MTTAFLRYTLMRLALFAVALLGLAGLGARGLLLVVLAIAVSMALSYLLLRRQRDALATAIAARIEHREAARGDTQPARPAPGPTSDEAAEDAEVAALHATRQPDQRSDQSAGQSSDQAAGQSSDESPGESSERSSGHARA